MEDVEDKFLRFLMRHSFIFAVFLIIWSTTSSSCLLQTSIRINRSCLYVFCSRRERWSTKRDGKFIYSVRNRSYNSNTSSIGIINIDEFQWPWNWIFMLIVLMTPSSNQKRKWLRLSLWLLSAINAGKLCKLVFWSLKSVLLEIIYFSFRKKLYATIRTSQYIYFTTRRIFHIHLHILVGLRDETFEVEYKALDHLTSQMVKYTCIQIISRIQYKVCNNRFSFETSYESDPQPNCTFQHKCSDVLGRQ